ncbi:MAG: hypothetical protein JSS86_13670 [Cyanobacteria bacterium SZAS LIN-2]|nr:hypothetical protein [Cyanobacteria bacterium SZAS LIN-3]MBS1997362.1 hypothetical protein [Cyanobacteria bacterium SZAS LIN-2]
MALSAGRAAADEVQRTPKKTIAAATKKVMVFHQKTAGMGKAELYLATDALRLVTHNGDVIAISKAPTWDIVLFSKHKNVAFEAPMAKIGADHMGLFKPSINLTKGKEEDCKAWYGFKCKQIVAEGGKNAKVEQDPFIFQAAEKPKKVMSVLFKCADIGPIDEHAQRAINWIYSQKRLPGLPLQLSTFYGDGSRVDQLQTMSFERSQVPDSFFSYPHGYTKSKNKYSILTSEDANATLEDLFGDTKPGK